MSLIETISNSLKQKPPHKKGGRPRKELRELRSHGVTIWFTDDEYNRLISLSNGTNLTVRQLIRDIVNSGKAEQIAERKKLNEEDLIFCKHLIKVAANINQAVKVLHEYKFNPVETDSLETMYKRLMNCINALQ